MKWILNVWKWLCSQYLLWTTEKARSSLRHLGYGVLASLASWAAADLSGLDARSFGVLGPLTVAVLVAAAHALEQYARNADPTPPDTLPGTPGDEQNP